MSAPTPDDLVGAALEARATFGVGLGSADDAVVALGSKAVPVLERLTAEMIRVAWSGHWLPGEVIRHARREISASAARFVCVAVVAEQSGWHPDELHPEWKQHIASLQLTSPATTTGWLKVARIEAGVGPDEVVAMALDVIFLLSQVPVFKEVIPAPGSKKARQADIRLPSDSTSAMLSKIRALLNQAESTNFDEEADAFTSKAQALMSRHSIDEAMLWSAKRSSDAPRIARLAVDDPYADAKAFLLQVVSQSGRCRSIYFPETGTCDVVGFSSDLVAAEALFTSLLVQSQAALRRQAASAPAGARVRSSSYRSSFMTAFSHRIGERLQEVNDTVVAEMATTQGDSLVPVLARRDSAVEDVYAREFQSTGRGTVRGGFDRLGREAGQQAADAAKLRTEALR